MPSRCKAECCNADPLGCVAVLCCETQCRRSRPVQPKPAVANQPKKAEAKQPKNSEAAKQPAEAKQPKPAAAKQLQKPTAEEISPSRNNQPRKKPQRKSAGKRKAGEYCKHVCNIPRLKLCGMLIAR